MEFLNRQFANSKQVSAFAKGAEVSLTKSRIKKVKLVRLSYCKEKFMGFAVEAVWARPEKPVANIFKYWYATSKETLEEDDWFKIGENVARNILHWVDNDKEFEVLEQKVHGQQFDIWKTSKYWDLAQDLIEELEYQFGPYLHGRLHWKVKSALAKMIEDLSMKVERENRAITENKLNKSPVKIKETIDGN